MQKKRKKRRPSKTISFQTFPGPGADGCFMKVFILCWGLCIPWKMVFNFGHFEVNILYESICFELIFQVLDLKSFIFFFLCFIVLKHLTIWWLQCGYNFIPAFYPPYSLQNCLFVVVFCFMFLCCFIITTRVIDLFSSHVLILL